MYLALRASAFVKYSLIATGASASLESGSGSARSRLAWAEARPTCASASVATNASARITAAFRSGPRAEEPATYTSNRQAAHDADCQTPERDIVAAAATSSLIARILGFRLGLGSCRRAVLGLEVDPLAGAAGIEPELVADSSVGRSLTDKERIAIAKDRPVFIVESA